MVDTSTPEVMKACEKDADVDVVFTHGARPFWPENREILRRRSPCTDTKQPCDKLERWWDNMGGSRARTSNRQFSVKTLSPLLRKDKRRGNGTRATMGG